MRTRQVAENDGDGIALGFLKQARGPNGEKLTAKEIEIELIHFFFAATAALSAALAWSLVVLGERPELGARLRAEADEILDDGVPSLAQIR